MIGVKKLSAIGFLEVSGGLRRQSNEKRTILRDLR
jgi:hypothetical protein